MYTRKSNHQTAETTPAPNRTGVVIDCIRDVMDYMHEARLRIRQQTIDFQAVPITDEDTTVGDGGSAKLDEV